MKSGALTGTTKPTHLTITVTRALGNRIGIQLNARNRIANVDKNTPAAKAGLLVLDKIMMIDGKSCDDVQPGGGGVMSLVDPNSTEILFVIERPHKSQRKKIIAEDNANESDLKNMRPAQVSTKVGMRGTWRLGPRCGGLRPA